MLLASHCGVKNAVYYQSSGGGSLRVDLTSLNVPSEWGGDITSGSNLHANHVVYFNDPTATADDIFYVTSSMARSWFFAAFPSDVYRPNREDDWSHSPIVGREIPKVSVLGYSGCPVCGHWTPMWIRRLSKAPTCAVANGRTTNQWLCAPSEWVTCPACGGNQKTFPITHPNLALCSSLEGPIIANRSGRWEVPPSLITIGQYPSDINMPTRAERELLTKDPNIAAALLADKFRLLGPELTPTKFDWKRFFHEESDTCQPCTCSCGARGTTLPPLRESTSDHVHIREEDSCEGKEDVSPTIPPPPEPSPAPSEDGVGPAPGKGDTRRGKSKTRPSPTPPRRNPDRAKRANIDLDRPWEEISAAVGMEITSMRRATRLTALRRSILAETVRSDEEETDIASQYSDNESILYLHYITVIIDNALRLLVILALGNPTFRGGSNRRWLVMVHTKGEVRMYVALDLERASFDLQDRRRYWRRRSDMVRVMGIQIKTTFVVNPKSGFRVRMIVFQSPSELQGVLGTPNTSHAATDKLQMGYFSPNATVMSEVNANMDGTIQSAALTDQFAPLFARQMQARDQTFHDEMMNMRMTAPNITILADKRRFISNRKRQSKTFKWNFFRRMYTTLKYPPVTFGEHMVKYPFPDSDRRSDRKIFVMYIITPATEQWRPPKVKLPSFIKNNPDDDLKRMEEEAKDDNRPIVFMREGSHFSDKFAYPDVDTEEVPLIAEPEPGEGGEGSQPQASGSKMKLRDRSPLHLRGGDDSSEDSTTDDDEVSHEHVQLRDAMISALRHNRKKVKKVREKERNHAAQNAGEVGPEDLNKMTNYWADKQAMMFQPEFNMWWKEMPKSMLNARQRRPKWGRRS
ncbi:hypothetical protein H4582DRAFT_2063942 [Lactarius indigo]|nr:hypothetical protein H4582DRAFT_2063933 [Lactarius indigo]KAI9430304.1 hypothetical protein H4582DRAFT_2063935 [Lactarius indigo]KAI9430307.1 hypothetical protein H4582DRAFT_2063937 [Lactarius indigo]KAI9430310.1 hypothetical protein H4582DRAFT_2063939 [Lactarius indigo]KAI9430320.1 hypothetical protein H4582DRAFT_2063942 [Lactarius indigo]